MNHPSLTLRVLALLLAGSLLVALGDRNRTAVANEEKQVRFQSNSARLDDPFKKVLDDVARALRENPDAILLVEGHTDSTGSGDYNTQLGQKRLEAVMRYLVEEREMPANRIIRVNFGKERPLSANDTEEGRAQNRAVVVRVMVPRAVGTKEIMVSQARPQTH